MSDDRDTDRTDDRANDLLRSIWKETDMHIQTPDIDSLRHCERQIEAQVTWRNRIEYVAGGLVIAFLLYAGIETLAGAETAGSVITGIGNLTVAAGTGWIILRLSRLTRAARAGSAGTPVLTHLRRRLTAERDMLRSAWRWYVMPLVPGFVLIYSGAALEPEPNWTVFWTGVAITTAIIAGVAWLNHRAAARVDRELARIEQDWAG